MYRCAAAALEGLLHMSEVPASHQRSGTVRTWGSPSGLRIRFVGVEPGLQSRRSALDDSLRVRVDVEALASREADEGHAAGVREVDRQARGRRHRDEHGNTREAGLLDQFEGGSSADGEHEV